ncbi:MAG: proton-conducting transporter membrane subunit [Microthrixaceae bacterium]
MFGAELGAGTLVALLLAVAALVRAAQLPLHRWLPGTVNALTPVSALLHAGVVNAGGFMLVRLGPLFGEVAAATWLVVLVTTATILWSAGRALDATRREGRPGDLHSAQMGFMLLACALGAPVAAISHLVGHGLYKSSRFLGSRGAIRSSVTTRRFATTDGGDPTQQPASPCRCWHPRSPSVWVGPRGRPRPEGTRRNRARLRDSCHHVAGHLAVDGSRPPRGRAPALGAARDRWAQPVPSLAWPWHTWCSPRASSSRSWMPWTVRVTATSRRRWVSASWGSRSGSASC